MHLTLVGRSRGRCTSGPTRSDCVGAAPQKCLRVREKAEQEWTLFYDSIQGFAYEEGFDYQLRVTREKVDDPAADAAGFRWTLVEQVSKTRALEGTTWLLESYLDPKGTNLPALAQSQVTARFQEGQVGGNASCNSYFGTFQLDGGKMAVQMGGSTMMYCEPEGLMTQEQNYLAALGKGAFYHVTNDELRIADGSGQTVLKFRVLQPVPLVGPTWQLSGYNQGDNAFVSVLAGTQITALFGADGSVTGSAGCNSYVGQVQVDGNSLSIGPLATTRMMCGEPQGVMEQETAYLEALSTVTGYRIQGSALQLLAADGAAVATYSTEGPAEAE